MELPELTQKLLFNVTKYKGNTYYYFMKESKPGIKISALVINQSGEKAISQEGLRLDTKVYASYVENESLFLLTAQKCCLTETPKYKISVELPRTPLLPYGLPAEGGQARVSMCVGRAVGWIFFGADIYFNGFCLAPRMLINSICCFRGFTI